VQQLPLQQDARPWQQAVQTLMQQQLAAALHLGVPQYIQQQQDVLISQQQQLTSRVQQQQHVPHQCVAS
jgi:hypothetical protein